MRADRRLDDAEELASWLVPAASAVPRMKLPATANSRREKLRSSPVIIVRANEGVVAVGQAVVRG